MVSPALIELGRMKCGCAPIVPQRTQAQPMVAASFMVNGFRFLLLGNNPAREM
jgi:hypothetical protein